MRLGDQWFTRFRKGTNEVLLVSKEGELIGKGTIKRVACIPLSELPVRWLWYCVDGELPSDVVQSMQAKYGANVTPADYVSVLWFTGAKK